jgi:hypothetical protein
MKNSACLKCGSAEVIEGVRVEPSDGGKVVVMAPREPLALITTAEKRNLLARVCGACGSVDLYIEDAAGFIEVANRRVPPNPPSLP